MRIFEGFAKISVGPENLRKINSAKDRIISIHNSCYPNNIIASTDVDFEGKPDSLKNAMATLNGLISTATDADDRTIITVQQSYLDEIVNRVQSDYKFHFPSLFQ